MMETNQTNTKDPKIIPLAKTDWIRFGALKIQAKSKKIWQVTAIVAIAGIIAITVTDGWLFMERKIRFEQLKHRMETLANQNKNLTLRLSSLKSAIKEYSRLISMTTNEKNQLAVEKGILQAQTELLMIQIESLEALIKDTPPESPQQPDEQQPAGSALTPQKSKQLQEPETPQASETPQDIKPPKKSKPSQALQVSEALEVSYVP
jgi:FtsZ-interacting cell division protein ZipA